MYICSESSRQRAVCSRISVDDNGWTVSELPLIPYLKLKFVLIAEQSCRLPRIKGSMLRGAFGHALRKIGCGERKPCTNCIAKSQCVYTHIFETLILVTPPPGMKGTSESPKPFVIDFSDQKTEFQEGDSLTFQMTLFGIACDYVLYIILAVQRMAHTGLARGRYRFQLFQAMQYVDNQPPLVIYESDHDILKGQVKTSLTINFLQLSEKARIIFQTPMRLKLNGHYVTDIDFRTFVIRMLLRVMEISYFFVPDAKVYWDFSEWMHLTKTVKIPEKNTRWQDWPRYSNSQQTKMNLGGFIGHWDITGDLHSFEHLISICTILHVGKATTFGLGKIAVQ